MGNSGLRQTHQLSKSVLPCPGVRCRPDMRLIESPPFKFVLAVLGDPDTSSH